MELTQENELISNLKNLVNNYLEKNPKLTLNALAHRSNVSVTSLRRLVLGEHKNEIAPHSVLNIVSYIVKERNISKLIQKIDSTIANFLKKHFGNFIFLAEMESRNVHLDSALKDQSKFLIFKMAQNHNGIEVKTIELNFGKLGLRKMDEMISDGIIEQKGLRVFTLFKEYKLGSQVITDNLSALLQFYRPEFSFDGLNHLSFVTESLSIDAINRIKMIQEKSFQEILTITKNPDNFGEKPFFYLNLSESLHME